MRNNIRQVIAKIGAIHPNEGIRAQIAESLQAQGIERVRFNQIYGNHRQPRTEETILILSELQKYMPELKVQELFTLSYEKQ